MPDTAAKNNNFWDHVDFILKLLFPICMLVVGWVVGQIDEIEKSDTNQNVKIATIEANRVVQKDLTELERRWQIKMDAITDTLHLIDGKVTSIQSKLDERDRVRQ